jgi:hypothetical protein
MAAKTLDTEINKYFALLGQEEKKSLLSVIISFLMLKQEEPQRKSLQQ